jgi:protein-S-isoprenylcysteine O-methyltransferase Ste14
VIAAGTRSPTRRPKWERLGRLTVNVAGALIAALFARRYLLYYLQSHRLIGVAFFVQQMWIMTAFLIRRPPRAVSRRIGDWVLAFGGTFGGVLLQPSGAHPRWGLDAGLGVQLVGLTISIVALLALGRSFGSVAADRGIVLRGPYGVVRHPVYTGYLMIQVGYVLQSVSWWNVAVVLFVTGCNVGRALAEELLLATSSEYEEYQRKVQWKLLPRIW